VQRLNQTSLTIIFLSITALLLIRNILRPDIIALLLVLSLGLTGILTPREAFSGFGRSAVVIMFSAFILAEGLKRSGITEQMGSFIVRLFGKGERRLIFGVMIAAALLSLVMNNIAAASLLFPALSGVARRSKISLSRLLMPLAFGTILGGMATLLTSTNIIVSGLLRDAGLGGLGLLDFAGVGIPMAIAGILFMTLIGYKFLPAQSPAHKIKAEDESIELLRTYQLNERLVRVRVRPGGMLDGKTPQESGLRERYHLNVIAMQRRKRTLPIEPGTTLQGNDVLLIVARPEDTLLETLEGLLEVLPAGQWQNEYLSTPNLILIEMAIAPRSPLAGQTLQEIRFRQKFEARVLAIWRHGRSIRTRFGDTPLEFGDGLLLQGTEKSLELLRTEPGFILLAEATQPVQISTRSWAAVLIMIAALVLSVIYPALISEILLSGAIGMVLTGILNMDDAYRSVEWRSLFLVAGMLSAGVALTKTGGAALVANTIISAVGGRGHFVLLAVLVVLTMLFTQIINGVATVTIMVPIGITVAQQAGMDPRNVGLAMAFASSMAFMSPLGHSVNVMVMGAGGYTFRDYARVGSILTVILVFILLGLLPLLLPI
jgi:di/tricarboxylate transporter